MFETIIKPIHHHTDCRQPIDNDSAQLLLILHDEASINATSFPESGPHLIIENALKANAVVAHPAMVLLIMRCMRGNPGFGHALTYALACEAFRQRTLCIGAKVFVSTFPLGLPSAEQLAEYWDVYKDGMRRAESEDKEHLLRPSTMLHALAVAGVDGSTLTDEQILDAFLNIDDDCAGDENYALPAD